MSPQRTVERIAQQILDEQGYVVVGTTADNHYCGEVLRNIDAPPYGPMAGPIVVSGPATADEYLAQGRKYFPDLHWPADARALGWPAYYKAVAE